MTSLALKLTSPNDGENHVVKALMVVGGMVWLILCILGLVGYSGSKVAYAVLSVVTGIMLIAGCWRSTSYGYAFLTVFLWLGLWLKLTVHTIFNYPFVEPVGSFHGGGQAWDEVVNVATVASLGVILAKLIFNLVRRRTGELRVDLTPTAPPWFASSRKWLWFGLILVGGATFFINMRYGIHQIGMVPKTILLWPLNAGIAWLLNIGLATGVAIILWWDMALKRSLVFPIHAIIVEALISSASILSRAAYIFHTIPQLWAAYRFRHVFTGWSNVKSLVLVGSFAFFFAISISFVTTLRNYLYQSGAYSSTSYQIANVRVESLSGAIPMLEQRLKSGGSQANIFALREELRKLQDEKLKQEEIMAREKMMSNAATQSGSVQSTLLLNEFGYQITGAFSKQIMQLSVDRWIGLEGLMAVQSYPEKDMHFFWRALTTSPEVGARDIYETISNSIYLKSDPKKFRFGSLPGAAAFLYYSNSQLVVVLGMTFFSLVVLYTEVLISALIGNPILCSLYGGVMASNVAQFGVSPRQSLPSFYMLACGIFLAWSIHTHWFTRVVLRGSRRDSGKLRGG